MPSVIEGKLLRIRAVARLIAEDDAVARVRVEGRIEIDEIDRLGLDVSLAEDVEVVP
jgi:hypothetical protein